MIADFQIEEKIDRLKFFQKIFLMVNTKFEVILRMIFLKISNTDVLFGEKKFMWKFYTIIKALITTKQV